jgi:hypothetical protein
MQNKSLDGELVYAILLNRFPGVVLLQFDPFVDKFSALRVFSERCRRVDVLEYTSLLPNYC